MSNNFLIGLDLKTLSLRSAGIGRYTISLVRQLIERSSFNYAGFISPNTELSLLPQSNLRIINGTIKNIQSTLLRSALFLPSKASGCGVDLFHSLDNSTIGLISKPKFKRVSTIHDLIVLIYPEFFTWKHAAVVKWMTSTTVKCSDHIIADSHSTKNDLLRFYPEVAPDKISVVHLAADGEFTRAPQDQIDFFIDRYKLPNRYFLSLATNEPRKNLGLLIEAFIQMKTNSNYEEIGLVLAGGKGWLNSDIPLTDSNKQRYKIHSLGFVPDKYLPILYSGALAFVYPSLYEGFGLPILEAMSCGQPIITSKISSIPEIEVIIG